MSGRTGFRSWYYFRQGWSVYFAFIFAAVNTLTVTYFLAIEEYPILKTIFPTFIHYIIIVTSIGIPFLVLVGYIHYKRTTAYRSEASVNFESNPFVRRNLINSEITVMLDIKIIQMLIKLMNNEKITTEERDELIQLHQQYAKFLKDRTLLNTKDLEFLKKMYKT